MLGSLLPGFRELRSPLAAGYLWLVAAWILWTPTCGDNALTESACRLDAAVSGAGLGAVAATSFAAYLVGAVSIAVCSYPLRRRLQADGLARVERLRPLSARADRFLHRLARECVARLSLSLALTETSVESVLDEVLGRERSPSPAIRPRSRSARRAAQDAAALSASSPAPPSEEEVHCDRLVAAMVGELDEIVPMRLLGRDPELFSAIDRHRSEVDFRLAVLPPLVAVLVVVAVGVPPLVAAGVVLGTLLFVAGLSWDALVRQREANDELAVALADGRVPSPAVERATAEAASRTDRGRFDEMRAVAAQTMNALRAAVRRADEIDSAPSRITAAREAVRDVRGHMTRFESAFPPAVSESGSRAVEAVDRAVRLREDAWAGRSDVIDPEAGSRRLVGESKHLASDFRRLVIQELEHVRPS